MYPPSKCTSEEWSGTRLPLPFQKYLRRNGVGIHLPIHFSKSGFKTKELQVGTFGGMACEGV